MEVLTQCFLDTFSTFSCVDVSFKYIWQNLGFGVLSEFAIQVEIFWDVVIWTITSQCYFELCLVFAKGICSITFPEVSRFIEKIRQIWLAVSCIVSVCFGGGSGTWEYHGKTQRFRWGTFLCGALVTLKLWKNWLMVDGAGFTFGAVPQFERCFFSMGRLQEFVGKSHMFPFFFWFCFGTFLLAKIKVCFVCMAYIMSILCGLIMFD